MSWPAVSSSKLSREYATLSPSWPQRFPAVAARADHQRKESS
jgi:hypothetical protein